MDRASRALAVLLRSEIQGERPDPSALPPLNADGWAALAASILQHRVAVPLGADLHLWGMPPALASDLADTGRLHRLRSDWLLLELRRVLERLGEAEVPAVVLKGAALVHLLGYPRFFLDLDVLVPQSALDLATRAVGPLGYAVGRTGRSDLYYERHHFHRVLRADAGITVELHWDLARPSDYFHLDPDGVRARARGVPFHGLAMQVPSESDQLLHAAEQSLREGFSDARRVLDAARLLRAGAGGDPALASRAHKSGLAAALWILLVVTEALTGCGAPELMEALRPGLVRRRSLEALDLPGLLLERRAERMRGLRGWLLLMCAPGPRVTARTLLRVVFPGERGLLEDGHLPEQPPSPFTGDFSASSGWARRRSSRHIRPGGSAPAGPRAARETAERMDRSMEETRICVLVSQLSYGGAERQTTILLEQLAARHGIRPLVCCMSPILEPFGERIRAVGCELIHWDRRKSYEWRRVFYLRSLLRARGIELLHAVHYQAVAYGWLGRLGLPGAAFVPSIRSTVYDPSLRKRMFYRLALPRCQVVIANSVSGKQWVEQFFGVPQERIEVVYNGIDPSLLAATPDRLAVRSRLGIPGQAPVLAFVGKTKPHKGLPLLRRIFQRVVQELPDTHLILMGTGLTEEWVRSSFDAHPHVHGLGTRRDIYDLLGSADCLLLTSTTEGFPNAVLEAMVLGVPPVTTKVGECPYMIEHGQDGFLFEQDDDGEGARLALQVLRDAGLRRVMGERGRTKSLERYGTEAMVETTLRIYRAVLARRNGSPEAHAEGSHADV